MTLINRLVYLRRHRFVREFLGLYGVEIPKSVKIGKDFDLMHRGYGTVIHPSCVIGDRVRIFHQVTVGRVDVDVPTESTKMEQIIIGDDVILCPGCKVLAGAGTTTVGRGTILGANSVLRQSTGEWEIWAGIPARKIGQRDRPRRSPLSSADHQDV